MTSTAAEVFDNALSELYGSRLIIVDKAISKFLETITKNEELYAVLVDCAKTASYKTEYQKAVSRDGVGSYFMLPPSPKHVVTLVSGLLFDFDRKTLSIVDFVTKFFAAPTSHESYLAFCGGVLTPYSQAFKKLLMGTTEIPDDALLQASIPTPGLLPDKAKEDVEYWLNALIDIITGDNRTADDIRREYLTMAKGLSYVTDGGNPTLIKLVWIGLKNTLGIYPQGNRELNEIKSILFAYGVLD